MLRHWQHSSALGSSSLLSLSLSRLLLNFPLSPGLGICGPAWPMAEEEEEMESDLLVGIWRRGKEMEAIKEIMVEVCVVGLWWWKENERWCCAVVALCRVWGRQQFNAPRTKGRLLLSSATRRSKSLHTCTERQIVIPKSERRNSVSLAKCTDNLLVLIYY